tara:strand:+ start:3074 stop:4984 length:1911 start_codon:yes stop_codon:yes gene_type:complete
MAYSPIAFTAANYRDYKFNWIKAYEPGTTTPKVMATDGTLATLIAKAEINVDGFIVSAGGALIIPFIEGSYDLYMFKKEADADANDTSEAVRLADNIKGAADLAGRDSTISELPPTVKSDGDRWIRCSDMKAFVWYIDADGAQWVEDRPSYGIATIQNLTLPYVFDSVSDMTDSILVFPVGKLITVSETKAEYVSTAGISPNVGSPAIAGGNHALLNTSGKVRLDTYGPKTATTLNAMMADGIKNIQLPTTLSIDTPIKPQDNVEIYGGWCVMSNDLTGADAVFSHDDVADGFILRWFRISDYKIVVGTNDGDTFNLKGMQHCSFGDFHTVNVGSGVIQFAYFNNFGKMQLQNPLTAFKFTGIAQSTDCNFNTIEKCTINNWTTIGLLIENSRGNIIGAFDAESSGIPTNPCLEFRDSSYNIVNSLWSEIQGTPSLTSTVKIGGTSGSNNKGNVISHIPQIITDGTGILIENSVGTRIFDVRLVGCSIGINDAGTNSGLVVSTAQFDACTVDFDINSNDTIFEQSPFKMTGKVNANHQVDSLGGGFGGYEYLVGGVRRFKATCKSASDVDFSGLYGNAMRWVDNVAGNEHVFEVSHSMHMFKGVASTDVLDNSLFKDSSDNKLKYKDSSGVVKLLY